jgi:hypothetical protein
MKTIGTMFLVLVLASLAFAQGYQNVQLLNKTAQPLTLVVDGANRCTAQANGGTCTAKVDAGPHHFDAADANGKVISSSDHTIAGDGLIQPWEICDGDYVVNGTCKD